MGGFYAPLYKELERILHKKLFADKVRGEWFNIDGTKIEELKQEIRNIEAMIIFMKENNIFMKRKDDIDIYKRFN